MVRYSNSKKEEEHILSLRCMMLMSSTRTTCGAKLVRCKRIKMPRTSSIESAYLFQHWVKNHETKNNADCKKEMNKRQSPELDTVQNFICIRRHDALQRNRPESRRRADDQHPVSSPRGAQCKLQQLRGFSGTGTTLQNKPHANESADSSMYAKPSSNGPQHHAARRGA